MIKGFLWRYRFFRDTILQTPSDSEESSGSDRCGRRNVADIAIFYICLKGSG